jgi:hypothetical protein
MSLMSKSIATTSNIMAHSYAVSLHHT